MAPCAAPWLLLLLPAAHCALLRSGDADAIEASTFYEESKVAELARQPPTDCPVSVQDRNPHDILEDIDDKFKADQSSNLQYVEKFDQVMSRTLLWSRGMAPRAWFEASEKKTAVPAGLNLGGHCTVTLNDSVIFFHRMKLRNNTRFTLNSIGNQLDRKLVYLSLNLNDLHLEGSYERAQVSGGDEAVDFYYQPSFGIAEFLLKDVKYLVQGRYRMIGDKLSLDMINSNIFFEDMILGFKTKDGIVSDSISDLDQTIIGDFIQRMKVDLDDWLKDFYNDFMTYNSQDIPKVSDDKLKTLALNELADAFLGQLAERQRARQAAKVLPRFTIHSVVGTRVELYQGRLFGLDSMYRRSAATAVTYATSDGTVRGFDAVVGFSDLNLIYGAELHLPSFGNSKGNHIILTANELTAHMEVLLDKDPKKVKVSFNFLRQIQPELLTLDGPISRDVANFKHLLELHVTTLLMNTLVENVAGLEDLLECGEGGTRPNNLKADSDETHTNEPEDSDAGADGGNEDGGNRGGVSEDGDNGDGFSKDEENETGPEHSFTTQSDPGPDQGIIPVAETDTEEDAAEPE